MSTLLFSSLQIKTPKKIPFPKINGWDEKELCSWNVPQSFAPFLSSRVCGQKLRPDQCPPSWKDESCRWRQSRSHHLARSSCSPAPSPLESICPQTCAHQRDPHPPIPHPLLVAKIQPPRLQRKLCILDVMKKRYLCMWKEKGWGILRFLTVLGMCEPVSNEVLFIYFRWRRIRTNDPTPPHPPPRPQPCITSYQVWCAYLKPVHSSLNFLWRLLLFSLLLFGCFVFLCSSPH